MVRLRAQKVSFGDKFTLGIDRLRNRKFGLGMHQHSFVFKLLFKFQSKIVQSLLSALDCMFDTKISQE